MSQCRGSGNSLCHNMQSSILLSNQHPVQHRINPENFYDHLCNYWRLHACGWWCIPMNEFTVCTVEVHQTEQAENWFIMPRFPVRESSPSSLVNVQCTAHGCMCWHPNVDTWQIRRDFTKNLHSLLYALNADICKESDCWFARKNQRQILFVWLANNLLIGAQTPVSTLAYGRLAFYLMVI